MEHNYSPTKIMGECSQCGHLYDLCRNGFNCSVCGNTGRPRGARLVDEKPPEMFGESVDTSRTASGCDAMRKVTAGKVTHGNVTEEYKFYNDEITLRFNKEEHRYYRVGELGNLIPVNRFDAYPGRLSSPYARTPEEQKEVDWLEKLYCLEDNR